MHVSELLARAPVDAHTSGELLRQAELRGTHDARAFLLQLRQWRIVDDGVVWTLRKVYNAAHPVGDKLWVPLTA